MKLYNCYSKEEKELKEVILWTLTVEELLALSEKIRMLFGDDILGDEIIVVDALHQINLELGRRLKGR